MCVGDPGCAQSGTAGVCAAGDCAASGTARQKASEAVPAIFTVQKSLRGSIAKNSSRAKPGADFAAQSILIAAHRIYQRAAFWLMKEETHHSFGNDLVGQEWTLELD